MEPPALFLGICLKNVEILVESVKTAVSGSEEKSAQLRVREVKCVLQLDKWTLWTLWPGPGHSLT